MTALNRTPEAAGQRWLSRRPRRPSLHPVNREFSDEAPVGARIADGVTGFLGSWKFIVIQSVIVATWIVGNLILLAGNRQALRDRMTLEHAASEADIEEKQNVELLEGNKSIAEGNGEILKRVEGLEKRILDLETSILGRLDKLQPNG